MDVELLKKIASNTSSKLSLTIGVNGTETRIISHLNPPIELNKEKKYEMALTSLDTFYSFPNVDADKNTLKWSSDAGNTWHTLILPLGSYELANISEAIQKDVLANGGEEDGITIQANEITFKVILKLKTNYRVDFNVNNSLRSVLGFEAKIYDQAYVESVKSVDIFSVNAIHVHADCISGSYIDGERKPVIYSFFPDVNPGYKIVQVPQNLVYLPLHTHYIRTLTVSLTDQHGKLLNLRNKRISIRFHLREV